jgi:hypothetical protein
MEVALDRAYAYIASVAAVGSMGRWALYYMEGTPPSNADELASFVNMNDIADIHAKSIAVAIATEAQSSTIRDVGNTLVVLSQTKAPVFKGGSQVVDTYNMYMPDRYFRVDGAPMDFLHGNPSFLSVYGVTWPTTNDNYEGFKIRDNTTDAVTVPFQLEYDDPIAVTAVRYGGTNVSELTSVTNVELQYWDSVGKVWVSKQSWAITAAYNVAAAGTNLALTTSVTASKFRLIFTCAAAFNVTRKFKSCGLMGSAVKPGIVKAPTWAIIVPIGLSYYSLYAGAYGWSTFRSRVSEYNYMPAIADTAGYNTDAKISLDASYNLLNYSFVLGNIVS